MSKGHYPLLDAGGNAWSPTAASIDHPLRGIPQWVRAIGAKLLREQQLTGEEEERLDAWRRNNPRMRQMNNAMREDRFLGKSNIRETY